MKKLYLFLLPLLCSMAFQWDNTMVDTDENRLALVIGNANYTGTQSKLDNPKNDAATMKATLEALGFEVIMETDLTLDGLNKATDKFEKRINELKKSPKKLVTLFYYSGHGMHIGSTSYLLPVNCKAQSDADLTRADEYGAFPLENITNRLSGHSNYLNIIMLDACRDNPFVEKIIAARGGAPGLLEGYAAPQRNTAIPKPSGMFYAYATAKGEIAKDGYGNNSPYVEGFVAALKTPNLSLEDVLKNTGAYVNKKVGSQNPCTESISFYGNFIFHKKEIPKDTDGDGYIDDVDNCIYEYSKTNNGCPDGTSDPFTDQMVRISGGTFQMGSNENDDEKPIHSVTVSSFYMSKYEVTQKQWMDIVGTTISQQRDKANKEWPLAGEGNNHPMYYVSWEDIQEFIKKLNTQTGKKYRLPTEAEWEYACRAGTTTSFNTGEKLTIEQANYSEDYSLDNRRKTIPVGSFLPNAWGLYDMHGNVAEWCSDSHRTYESGEVTNPKGPNYDWTRMVRGGAWGDKANSCRSAYRYFSTPSNRFYYNGFRLVL